MSQRRFALLSVLDRKILGFHSIKALYVEDEDFKKVVEDSSLFDSILQDGFLFKRNKFCIFKNSPRNLVMKEP